MKKLSIILLTLALAVVFTVPAMANDKVALNKFQESFISVTDKVVKLSAENERLEAENVDAKNDALAIGVAGGAFIGAGGVQALAVAIGSLNPVMGLVALGVYLYEKGE